MMRSLGNDIDKDPFDISREAVVEHAQRAAWYSNVIAELAFMRDDEAVTNILQSLIADVRLMAAAQRLVVDGKAKRSQAAA